MKMKGYVAAIYILCSVLVHIVELRTTGGRIIHGNPATAGDFPFAAAIQVQRANTQFFCTGTIYSSEYVLTAAHCVDGADRFTIKLGSHKLDFEDSLVTYTNTSTEYVMHPDFNSTTLQHDLALIHFPPKNFIHGFIATVDMLPEKELKANEEVITVGWGQLITTAPVNDLHFATMNIISNEDCKRTYGDQITDDMVCAIGDNNQGTCLGDSGGPLVQKQYLDKMMIVGVATFVSANGCGGNQPSGFVRVFPYWEWMWSVTHRIV